MKIPEPISTTTAMAITCARCLPLKVAKAVAVMAPGRARQCTSQFLAWQISFELFTQRDENEGQAAEHNSGESDCDRYGHPHLLHQEVPLSDHACAKRYRQRKDQILTPV